MLALLGISGPADAGAARDRIAPPWVPEGAHDEAGQHLNQARLEARLLVDAGRATPEQVRVGVLFDLDPGWHLYWKNSGDTGLPTELDIQTDGATTGELHWPAPEEFREADGAFVTYGYSGQVLLMTDLALDPTHDAEYRLAVDADLLICETECIPASVSVSRSLTEALVDTPDNLATTALFEHFEAQVPVDAGDLDLQVEALYSKSGLAPGAPFEAAIAVHPCPDGSPCAGLVPHAEGASFFPDSDDAAIVRQVRHLAAEHAEAPAFLHLAGETDEDAAPSAKRLTGVLKLVDRGGAMRAVRVDLPLPIVAADAEITELGAHWVPAAPPTPAASTTGILQAVLLALLGGLILNLMPCVLPVLAIKVFAVAEMAGRSRRELLANGGAYAAGILASMAALAGVVLTLRAIGTEVGWGFQFQSPAFIAVISIVLVAFALNLFGVFEISPDVGGAAQIGADSEGTRRSFFEGLLAVVLATPCSAPFLGTAVGFAFASSPVVIVAIFLAIGVGLALPFVLVTFVPGLSRFMPRSGPWMNQLRAGLGFALLATVIWLLWLTGGVAGVQGLVALLALLLVVSFGLFLYGAVQNSERRMARLGTLIVTLAVTVIGLDLVNAQLSSSAEEALAPALDEGWEPWSPSEIEAALQGQRPVLVVFSAEWCITCKVNEEVVLRSSQVQSELERLDVRVFKADWTKRDDTIRRELARHGRAGVPLYLVYDPRDPAQPVLLPELLSVGEVVESLRGAAGSRAAS